MRERQRWEEWTVYRGGGSSDGQSVCMPPSPFPPSPVRLAVPRPWPPPPRNLLAAAGLAAFFTDDGAYHHHFKGLEPLAFGCFFGSKSSTTNEKVVRFFLHQVQTNIECVAKQFLVGNIARFCLRSQQCLNSERLGSSLSPDLPNLHQLVCIVH